MFCKQFISAVLGAACVAEAWGFAPTVGMPAGKTLALRQSGLSTTRPAVTGMQMATKEEVLAPLFEANKKWIAKKKSEDPKFFDRLGSVHKPEVFWIGCADSRVAANEIIGAEPGEVFVHRNIANVVMKNDVNLLSGLQYAVDVLEVEHIIVCGHYNCGGIAASLTPANFAAPLENWVSHIRNVYRIHADELDPIKDQDEKLKKLVQFNVKEQCLNVYELAIVQARLKDSSSSQPFATPRIHAAVYDVGTGKLEKIDWFPKDAEDTYDMKLA
eukprot:805935-Rhodomonas_salina.2